MDIAALSTALAMQNTGVQVSMAVLKLGKEVIEQSGTQLMNMMKQIELSVNPHAGSQINIHLSESARILFLYVRKVILF